VVSRIVDAVPFEEQAASAPPTGDRASSARRLRALVRKEFVQIRRDRRTLALIIFVPVTLMIIFGYAATFDTKHLSTEFVAHDSPTVRATRRR
jgi:hypothetical protein